MIIDVYLISLNYFFTDAKMSSFSSDFQACDNYNFFSETEKLIPLVVSRLCGWLSSSASACHLKALVLKWYKAEL